MKRIEIGSWQVWELWEQEWPSFIRATKYEQIVRLGDTGDKPRPINLHWFTNLQTEYWRQFAYTHGHLSLVPVVDLLPWLGSRILWVYGAARLTWEWLS